MASPGRMPGAGARTTRIFAGRNPLPPECPSPRHFLEKNTGGTLCLTTFDPALTTGGLARKTVLEFSLDDAPDARTPPLKVAITTEGQGAGASGAMPPDLHFESLHTRTDRFPAAYHAFTGKPSTMKTYKTGETWTLDETRNNIAQYWEPPFAQGSPAGGYAVSLAGTDRVVGHVALFEPDQAHREAQLPNCAEIGFLLDSDFHGKKIGHAMGHVATNILPPAMNALRFTMPSGAPLESIEASVSPSNAASKATLMKIGLADTGRREQRYDGERHFLQMETPAWSFE